MIELIEQILTRAGSGESIALCVIVAARGSTPQRVGAAMLVLADGKTLGTLGGGCVEAEVRVRALELLQSRQSKLIAFRLDHDYGWDDGLVCGGTMEIAVQFVDPTANLTIWQGMRDDLLANRAATLRLNVTNESGTPQEFVQRLPPTPTLIIAGAGHVGQALGRLAPQAGFNLVVIDDRPDFASTQRFPDARCIVGAIERELAAYPITEDTYIVIVTRGHRHDGQALAAIINSSARYIGLIGSKRKVLTVLGDLHQQGIAADRLLAVHAPIGLDIGAVTPGEIAVSILAELIAVRRGKTDEPVKAMRIRKEQLERIICRPPQPAKPAGAVRPDDPSAQKAHLPT